MTYLTTKQQLLVTPTPSETRTYKPITHGQLIDLTLNSIVNSGFKVDKEIYSMADGGQIANGRYTLSNVADKEMQIQIGWQNSYNKKISLKFAIGAHVFICQNGCVHGDMGAFKKKHQGSVQEFTPTAISEYIKHAGDIFQTMQNEREAMKTIELSAKTKAELIGRMFIQEQIISATQLGIIAKELKAPTHDYSSENSLWELYQYTTFAMKEEHPLTWIKSHMDAHKFFVNESGVLVSNTEILVPEISPNQLSMFTHEVGVV